LVRDGINILVFSPVDPDFYTDDSGARIIGSGSPEIDVSPQSMKRDTALDFFFPTAHLIAPQAAGDFDSNPFGTGTHSRGGGHLDCTAESDTAFQLVGDILGN
jgi:hypothetical protein